MKINNRIYPKVKQEYNEDIITVYGVGGSLYHKGVSIFGINSIGGIVTQPLNTSSYKVISPYDVESLNQWVKQQGGIVVAKSSAGDIREITDFGIHPLQDSELTGAETFPRVLTEGTWMYWRDLLFKEPLHLNTLLRNNWKQDCK